MDAEATASEQAIVGRDDRGRAAHHADRMPSFRLAACEIADMTEQPACRGAEHMHDSELVRRTPDHGLEPAFPDVECVARIDIGRDRHPEGPGSVG